MPQFKLDISYSKNEGLVISPSELIDMYLTGIPLCYPDGGSISPDSIKQKILSAQKQIENVLSIKLAKQKVFETADFIREEFFRWGYIKTVFPIMTPLSLDGYINNVQQVHYPKQWLSCMRGTDTTKFRNLYLIPNTEGGAVMTQNAFVFSGITPHMGFFGTDFIPNYWRVNYCTGWDNIPMELISALGKAAAIPLLAIAGDLIFGAGIGNSSISIDGISQTYSTTKGQGGAFAGRIKQYTEEFNNEWLELKAEYRGLMFKNM
jgi:hypothetical protein